MKKVFNAIIYIFALIGFVLTAVFFAVETGITNEEGIIDNQKSAFTENLPQDKQIIKERISWQGTEEWSTIKQAIIRDREPIYKAAALLGVKPRTIVSIVVVEQLRLFNDNRETFKKVFAPLKILGVQSQFSWGVVGIKQDTAIATELHLTDHSSPFYLGKEYEHVLDFKTNTIEMERYSRITNERDRYYSYLYAATLIKQLETQWERAGHDISKKPGVIATLFNIGFNRSIPNSDPKVGGASITVASTTYSFGGLAQSFYNSNELTDIFPK